MHVIMFSKAWEKHCLVLIDKVKVKVIIITLSSYRPLFILGNAGKVMKDYFVHNCRTL